MTSPLANARPMGPFWMGMRATSAASTPSLVMAMSSVPSSEAK
jgi:hypothetical protein